MVRREDVINLIKKYQDDAINGSSDIPYLRGVGLALKMYLDSLIADVEKLSVLGTVSSEDIVQIVSAPPNLYARYENEGELECAPIVCLGLTRSGAVIPMSACCDGDISDAIITNFHDMIFTESPKNMPMNADESGE